MVLTSLSVVVAIVIVTFGFLGDHRVDVILAVALLNLTEKVGAFCIVIFGILSDHCVDAILAVIQLNLMEKVGALNI